MKISYEIQDKVACVWRTLKVFDNNRADDHVQAKRYYRSMCRTNPKVEF